MIAWMNEYPKKLVIKLIDYEWMTEGTEHAKEWKCEWMIEWTE